MHHAPDGQCRGKIDLRIVAYSFVLQNIYAHMQIFEKYIYMHIAYGPTQDKPNSGSTSRVGDLFKRTSPGLNPAHGVSSLRHI